MRILKYFCGIVFALFVLFVTVITGVSAAGHQHSFNELYTVKPTCTEKGYTVFSCDCGESCEGDIKNALGHNYGKEVVCFEKSTCTAKGYGGRYCKRCYAKTDIIYYGKTEHKPVYTTVKATAKRNGKRVKECSVCKKVYSTKEISKISSVKLEKKTYTYDGKVKLPSVIIKDSKGKKLVNKTDYTLKYQKGRKKTGTYSVTVTFKGNYEGRKTLNFKIVPTAVKNIGAVPSITSVALSWDKSKGADGYEIYLKDKKSVLIKDTVNLYCTVSKIDGKKLKSGTDYVFIIKAYKKSGEGKIYSLSEKITFTTKPQKAKLKKAKASSGKLTVTAEKQSCHGYEFLLSTNKSFSNPIKITQKGKSKTTCTFGRLTKGKRYYVKVRAYVASGGEKYRGYYSDVKTFKA